MNIEHLWPNDWGEVSRRDCLKSAAAITLAGAVTQLGCTANGVASVQTGGPVDLRNPEQEAGTERIRNHIRRSRELALAELKPTRKQIDRALELHRDTIVCDPMGGVLPAFGFYTPEMDEFALRELARVRAGDPNRTITAAELETIGLKVDEVRPFELVSNQLLQKDHKALLRASGRTLSTLGAEPWTVPGSRVASQTYSFDNVEHMEKFTRPEQAAELKRAGRYGGIWCNHSPLTGAKSPVEAVDQMYLLGVRQAIPWLAMDDTGRAVVKRMNQLGMVVDTAHFNESEIVAASDQPVLCSHTCCKAVHHGYSPIRNMTDKGLKTIADSGGVVAICTLDTLVGGVEGYTIGGGLAHIRHAVKLIGADHVGVSSDRGLGWAGLHPELIRAAKPANLIPFSQAPRYPGGWGKIRDKYIETWEATTQPHALKPCVWPYNVTLPLVMEGYSDEQIRNIIGGNVLRLYEQVLARKPTMHDV